jgi:fumarylacetoacetase
MTTTLNETHDPSLTSWVNSANIAGTDFPIQNLPFAVFRRKGSNEPWRGGVAIGDRIVDLGAIAGSLSGEAGDAAKSGSESTLNNLMAMGPSAWSALRLALSKALRAGAPHATQWADKLVPQSEAEYTVPAHIGDYTDFYTSIHHATNVGKLFRPDNPLMPNYKWVPIGYHGRSSSIGVSGQRFPRPQGQLMPPGATQPEFGPSKRLDYEMELGIFIGTGNELGKPIPITDAESHIFGMCILNDWSARDIQAWEYQPLGPFLAKNFASTISPWIVTLEALAPYRAPLTRPEGDPQPLPYLSSTEQSSNGAIDVQVEVLLESEAMRKAGTPPARLSLTSYQRAAYWTPAQLVTHHTVNGCNLQAGDLLGTGTLSGPTKEQSGALLEITVGGKEKISLPNGEQRTFIEDGDAIIMRGWCEKPGAARIGFGECKGVVLPARQ